MQELFISNKRMSKYKNDVEYVGNIKFSQFCYPLLHYFEITLRNKINSFYAKKYGSNWLITPPSILKYDISVMTRINEIKEKYRTSISNDDIIANLTLGFWVELFNPKYLLRTQLYKEQVNSVFGISAKNIHKDYLIKLHNELNTIRGFRNRIFHFEKVFNNTKYLYAPRLLEYMLYRMDSKQYLIEKLKQFGVTLAPPPRL
ncbi:MAG: hypothetical protein ACK5Z5_04070 [Neisseriaceae bacterium]